MARAHASLVVAGSGGDDGGASMRKRGFEKQGSAILQHGGMLVILATGAWWARRHTGVAAIIDAPGSGTARTDPRQDIFGTEYPSRAVAIS